MGRITVFANQKGGVGKTTSAANLGAYLALAGKKVLLVDFDPQGNLSSTVSARTGGNSIYEVITESCSARDAIQQTVVAGLDIIPSSIDLTGAGVELVSEQRREFFLREGLQPVVADYDYIFADCPPSLGILTLNGLVAADNVIIPLQCEYFAMEGLTQLLSSIRQVKRTLNPTLTIQGILFTMYDTRNRLSQDVVQEVVAYFKERVFRTVIPRNVRLSEAPSHGVPICRYEPECAGARAYEKLAAEVLERG